MRNENVLHPSVDRPPHLHSPERYKTRRSATRARPRLTGRTVRSRFLVLQPSITNCGSITSRLRTKNNSCPRKASRVHLKYHSRRWRRSRRHLQSTLSAQCGQRTQAYQSGFRPHSPAGDRTPGSSFDTASLVKQETGKKTHTARTPSAPAGEDVRAQ